MTEVKENDLHDIKDATSVLDYSCLYADCFAARDAFRERADRFLQKRCLPPFAVMPQSNNWIDVESAVSQACLTLNKLAGESEAVHGFTGRLRRAYRGLCNNSGTISCYLDLIPSDMMISSTLRGALQVVFLAMESSANYQQAIFCALEEIPIILADRAATLKIFITDEVLHTRMAALYVEMMVILRHILKYFTKNSFTTELKNLVQPNAAEERMIERVAQLKLRAEQFKERVLVLSQLRQDEVLCLQQESVDLQRKGIAMHAEGMDVQNQMGDDIQDIKAQLEWFRKQLERLEVLHNISKDFKPEGPAGGYAVTVQGQPQTVVTNPRLRQAGIQVLKMFQYDAELVPEDIRQILRGQQALSPTDSRTSYLTNSARLQAWLSITKCSMLLVNGRCASSSVPDVSVVSARLVASLLAARPHQIVPLAFFCGRHRQIASDIYGSPAEMSMSLILQLVHRYARFSDDELSEIVQGIDPRDVGSICDLLEASVRKLPGETTLFVVLDGIDCFSDPPERAQETLQIVSRLVKLSRQPPRATLKLLFSGSTRSRFVEHLFTDSEIMNVPTGVF